MSNILGVQKQSFGLGLQSTQRKLMNNGAVPKQALKQKRFHEHYYSVRHNGIEDWVITLIDNANTLKELRRKGLYWMYKLKIMHRTVLTKGMSV